MTTSTACVERDNGLDQLKTLVHKLINRSDLLVLSGPQLIGKSWSGITVLKASDFWGRLSGVPTYGAALMSSAENKDICRRYLARSFLQVISGSEEKKTGRSGSEGEFKTGQPHDAIEFLCHWAKQPPFTERNVLLFGERGSGKTWILKRFAIDQYKEHEKSPWLVPPALYINLRDYADYLLQRQGIEKSLAYYLYSEMDLQSRGEIYLLEALIQSGQIILLLDSFDEMSKENLDSITEQHYRSLMDYLPARCKAVIATRGTRFASLKTLFDLFTGAAGDSSAEGELVYIPSLRSDVPLPKHNLFTISPFPKEALEQLARMQREKPDGKRLYERVNKLLEEQSQKDFIAKQCCQLAEIPAAAQELLKALQEEDNYLRAFERSLIYPLIAYNVETGRSLVKIRYRSRSEGDIKITMVDLKTRLDVAEHIAWHLLEALRDDFDTSDIANTSVAIASTRLQEVVNDLRAQTIFLISVDTPRLSFRLSTIQAYFAARYIFSRLCSDRDLDLKAGVRSIGRYSLMDPKLGETIAGFLKLFVTHGMTQFKPDEIDVDPSDKAVNIVKVDQARLKAMVSELLTRPPAYSVWTEHLSENLKLIGCSLPELQRINEWELIPLVTADETFAKENGHGVLVAGDRDAGLAPFTISRHEETNYDFLQFLQSDLIPDLRELAEKDLVPVVGSRLQPKSEVIFVERRRGLDGLDQEHPLSWNAIHPASEKNKLCLFTNDYHLFEWYNGRFPTNLRDHPVDWLSAYVAAIYCNWKTLAVLKRREEDCCYKVYLTDNGPRLLVDFW